MLDIFKSFIKKYGYSFLVVLSALIVHSLLLKLSGVNLEFTFVDAANYFKTLNPILIHQFFYYEANTLGVPYLAHCISSFFPKIEMLVLIRVINLVGLILMSIGIINICRFLNKKNYVGILILLILNPLMWTYAGRATSDFLPMSLGIFSISLALGPSNFSFKLIFAALSFAFSSILKYHSLVLLVFWYALLSYKYTPKFILKRIMFISIIAISILAYYLLTIKKNFGFWITPIKFQHQFEMTISNVLNNFILYTGFLGLLVLPTSFISKDFIFYLKKFWKKFLFVLLILFFFSSTLLADRGELNFGPLDAYLGEKFRILILSLLIFIPLFFMMIPDKDRKFRWRIGASIFFVLLLLSSSRPAQRYLLFVIPFFIFFIPDTILKSRVVIFSSALLFFMTNSFIELSRYATGSASELMVNKLSIEGMLQQTNPGIIEAHVGDKFFDSRDVRKSYIVVLGRSQNTIFSVSSGYGFYKKTFSLEKIK